MNLVKVHVWVDVVRRRHDLHQAGVHVLRVCAVECAGPLLPRDLVRVRHEDDDDRDGSLAIVRRVEDQIEGGVEVVGRLIETIALIIEHHTSDLRFRYNNRSPHFWGQKVV